MPAMAPALRRVFIWLPWTGSAAQNFSMSRVVHGLSLRDRGKARVIKVPGWHRGHQERSAALAPPGGEAVQAASQRNARPPTMQRNCMAELPRCWPIGRQSLIIWRNAHCKGCPPKRLLNPITRCPPFPKTALSNTSNSRSPASPQE